MINTPIDHVVWSDAKVCWEWLFNRMDKSVAVFSHLWDMDQGPEHHTPVLNYKSSDSDDE